MLEFHGLNDTTIPYAGGVRHKAQLPGILDWLARWADRNGCAAGEQPQITSQNDGNVKHYSYSCHTHHYAINNLGHDWPSTSPNGDNPDGTYINATPIIMEFFNKVTKPDSTDADSKGSEDSVKRQLASSGASMGASRQDPIMRRGHVHSKIHV